MSRGCADCRFADWSRNPKARAQGPGDCRYVVTEPPLPISITRAHGFSPKRPRTAIWKDMGADCPTWEPAE